MQRTLLPLLLLGLFGHAAASAQLTVTAGVGLTSPIGDFADVAGTGYHGRAGVGVGIPTLPVSLRLDGDYHRLGEAQATTDGTTVLSGALSVVLDLPGVGLVPYLLAGVGRYRVDRGDTAGDVTDSGFHGGFGINLGAVGFGGYVEIRAVRISADGSNSTYVPLTIGLRL